MSGGKFKIGWFRGNKAQQKPSQEEMERALAWQTLLKGRSIGSPPEPGDPVPYLAGKHLVLARLGCGCVVICCPQEPDTIYLPGASGCTVDHKSRLRGEPNSNETPASVGSPPVPSNADGISEEALTLAAGGMAEFPGIYCVPQVSQDPIYDRLARSALAAAMPELRRQIAEEIAAAIEADLGEFGSYADQVITRNARLTRAIGGKA